jgi:hypothetical protein
LNATAWADLSVAGEFQVRCFSVPATRNKLEVASAAPTRPELEWAPWLRTPASHQGQGARLASLPRDARAANYRIEKYVYYPTFSEREVLGPRAPLKLRKHRKNTCSLSNLLVPPDRLWQGSSIGRRGLHSLIPFLDPGDVCLTR